jgi:hypothetical protein
MDVPAKKKVIKKKTVTEEPKRPQEVPKKRVTRRGKAQAPAGTFDKYIDTSLTPKDYLQIASRSIETRFKLDVGPPDWAPRNRARFPTWIDKTFKYDKIKDKRPPSCLLDDEAECKVNVDGFSLFPHQSFIKDYIQFSSPYRGMLLFHGLGSGKSCTSIAAAEILMNHMDVVIMVPASLRDNYLLEIKKCGRKFFHTKQHWIFASLDHIEQKKTEIIKALKLDEAFVSQQGGVWLPVQDKPSNFEVMPETVKQAIQAQIDAIISKRFSFINYNGLTRNHIEKLIENDTNPFDNKCVVIDEIHNLISRIANSRVIGNAIYKLLMSAKNCKLIMLSGTPIINSPHEIAYLVNLITGPRTVYEVKINTGADFSYDTVKEALESNKYIDYFHVDINTRKIILELLPAGFAFSSSKNKLIAREAIVLKKTGYTDNDKVNEIVDDLKAAGLPVSKRLTRKTTLTLPEKEEDFNKYFVDFATNKTINEHMFMRRILGTVSFYNSFSPDLFPSVTIHDESLEMGEYQYNIYEKSRLDERKKETASKKKKGRGDAGAGNIFNSGGQVYRFYSRANCNFVFPEEIKRPFPSKLSQIKKEVDDFDEMLDAEDDVEEGGKSKSMMIREYMALVDKALEELRAGDYLKLQNINKYSPKFEKIIKKVGETKGTALVYSQFRKVEGLGVLGLAMSANGYAPLRLKREGESWVLNVPEEDAKKPKYVMFTGNDEETKILLKIFNSDIESIPESVRDGLKDISTDGKLDNMHGSFIKVMMITQSGAEGISLKNVRQVHLIEPYWNHIRIDQVIGRAVRTRSHVDLPVEERNVDVYIYNMKFSKKQVAASFTIRTQDKAATSDEYIYGLAKNKKQIVDGFLDLLKKASVDCALNAKVHGNLKCFAFPVNMDPNAIVVHSEMTDEMSNTQYKQGISEKEWTGDVLVTKKGSFLIRKDTMEVYDYDLYKESGRLVKVGVLRVVKDKKTIVMPSS